MKINTESERFSSVRIDFRTSVLHGAAVQEKSHTVADLAGLFLDEGARRSLDQATVVYRVQSFLPVAEGTPGGLFWGSTFVEPGLVGDEYFMTKGHFHANRDRAEYYVTGSGEGMLILMDEDRQIFAEPMRAGSVHYIPGCVAHRVANTGLELLSFFACWPSDAGHDYGTIVSRGFPARLRRVDGKPTLVSA